MSHINNQLFSRSGNRSTSRQSYSKKHTKNAFQEQFTSYHPQQQASQQILKTKNENWCKKSFQKSQYDFLAKPQQSFKQNKSVSLFGYDQNEAANDRNHLKIVEMKNTLENMFENSRLDRSKSFLNSVKKQLLYPQEKNVNSVQFAKSQRSKSAVLKKANSKSLTRNNRDTISTHLQNNHGKSQQFFRDGHPKAYQPRNDNSKYTAQEKQIYRKSQQLPKHSKNLLFLSEQENLPQQKSMETVYHQNQKTNRKSFNQKLHLMTSKLRQIAENSITLRQSNSKTDINVPKTSYSQHNTTLQISKNKQIQNKSNIRQEFRAFKQKGKNSSAGTSSDKLNIVNLSQESFQRTPEKSPTVKQIYSPIRLIGNSDAKNEQQMNIDSSRGQQDAQNFVQLPDTPIVPVSIKAHRAKITQILSLESSRQSVVNFITSSNDYTIKLHIFSQKRTNVQQALENPQKQSETHLIYKGRSRIRTILVESKFKSKESNCASQPSNQHNSQSSNVIRLLSGSEDCYLRRHTIFLSENQAYILRVSTENLSKIPSAISQIFPASSNFYLNSQSQHQQTIISQIHISTYQGLFLYDLQNKNIKRSYFFKQNDLFASYERQIIQKINCPSELFIGTVNGLWLVDWKVPEPIIEIFSLNNSQIFIENQTDQVIQHQNNIKNNQTQNRSKEESIIVKQWISDPFSSKFYCLAHQKSNQTIRIYECALKSIEADFSKTKKKSKNNKQSNIGILFSQICLCYSSNISKDLKRANNQPSISKVQWKQFNKIQVLSQDLVLRQFTYDSTNRIFIEKEKSKSQNSERDQVNISTYFNSGAFWVYGTSSGLLCLTSSL